MGLRMETFTVSTQVKITNTYSTRWNSIVISVPTPDRAELDEDELDEWWWEVVFPLTGDGKGESENALYEAIVIGSDVPKLVGEQYNWSG